MITLLINTATKQNELFVIDGDNIRGKDSWISNRDESDKLLPRIDALFALNKLTFDNLNRICTITGPGGFTSLRVGIAIANTIAYAQHIPIGGIPLFDFWKTQIETNMTDYLIVHSATKKEIFVEGVGVYKEKYPNIQLIDFTDFKNKFENGNAIPYIGELVDIQKEALPQFQLIETSQKSVPNMLNTVEWKEGEYIEPFYGRMGQIG